MRFRSMTAAFLAFSTILNAQSFSPWYPPANLGPIVNTPSTDGCPGVAKDDLTLLVTSNRAGGYGGFDLYVTNRSSANDPWGPLQNLGPAINSASNEICPTLTIDGHRLFLVSDRPGGCGGQDLWVARRHDKKDDFGWEIPQNPGCTINSASNDLVASLLEVDGGPTLFYFSSNRPGGLGGTDIYVTTLGPDGRFGIASAIAELNTASDDQRPNVRKDGLEIYFDSNRPGGFGASDLWVATRASTAMPWSVPVNLGPTVNTASVEGRPIISFDKTSLYFFSDRPGGQGSNDAYVTMRAKHGN
jgi:Tol biopolymer transport system component